MLDFFSKEVRLALDKLAQCGYTAYLIGGSVRDYLMGRNVGDIDIATNALPTQVEKVFEEYKTVETGIKHGTVTVIINKNPIEITTFRTDGDYSDNRRPDTVEFSGSLENDVLRRDFTINSIAISQSGELVDLCQGKEDIEQKLIKSIGDPDKRFSEDALRILRALRFSAVLDFDIETKTSESIHKNKALLKNVSVERISAELKKMIVGPRIKDVLLEYADVVEQIIPEIGPCINFDQKNHHHIYDVYTHSVYALSYAKNDIYTRIALLFHDIGKPATASFDETGEQHFYGHPKVSAEITDKILQRLHFSNAEKKCITELVALHDSPMYIENRQTPSYKRIKRIMAGIGAEQTKRLIDIRTCDNKAQNSYYYLGDDYYETLYSMVDKAVESNLCLKMSDLAIDGNLLKEMGYQNKQIGKILKEVLKLVIDEKLENDKDKIIEYIENKKAGN